MVNNTFIWDTQNNTIRESEFCHHEKYQDLQVDMIGTPMLSMFPTFDMGDRKRLKSPAIFVRNGREKIIYREEKITDHTQRYSTLEREPYTIVEQVQEQENIEQLTMRTIFMYDRREMTIWLLEKMLDQPDGGWSDMLKFIIDRMDYPEFNEEWF